MTETGGKEKRDYETGGGLGFLLLNNIGDGNDGPRSTVKIFGRTEAEFAGRSEEKGGGFGGNEGVVVRCMGSGIERERLRTDLGCTRSAIHFVALVLSLTESERGRERKGKESDIIKETRKRGGEGGGNEGNVWE